MSTEPGIFLIDSSIYVFRAWFTMPDTLVNTDGELVNALYGFADFLLELIENEKPTHIVCAFDESLSESYRNEIYPEYKANREPAPIELKKQFQYCRELVRTMGIAEFASPRYEADDIIGTLSRNMRRHGFRSIIISGDKDLTQLLQENDLWWEYGRDKRLDSKGVLKTFGVHPNQIADLLALAGDAVDNIRGIPGVGLKTAANLLTKFKTLDNLLENVDKIGAMKFRGAKRIQNLVEEHQDAARLAKQLTVIAHDEQLPDQHKALEWQGYNSEALEVLFEQIGFGSFRRQRWHRALETVYTG